MSARVAHLVTRLNVGGIARFLEQAREAVPFLLRGRVEGAEREALWRGPQAVLPSLHRRLQPIDDGRALGDLLRALRRLKPDLLHTHASKAGALGRIAARLLGIPCVHTFHGHVLSGYFPRPLSALAVRVERLLAPMACVTATGPATAADLARRLGRPVEVIAPGVSLPPPSVDARARWRRSLGNPALVALCVGRAAAVKDMARFVEAARAAGFLPVVAGASAVRGAVALGHVEAMQDLYAAADVLVCASRAEGTPYALLEAMWSGLPVVSTPVGDVAWIVGGAGAVTGDLASALARLRDPELRRERGAAAARRVRDHFPASALAPRLLDLYERTLRG